MAKKPTQKPTPKAIPKAGVKNNTPVAETKKSWSPVTKYALFLGVLAFCVYANTLQNGYVEDDDNAIVNNILVKKGVIAIPEILCTPYHYGCYKNSNELDALYRPLSLIMFAIEYQLFPANPMPQHLINVLVFAGCVILFFVFFIIFLRKRDLSLLSLQHYYLQYTPYIRK